MARKGKLVIEAHWTVSMGNTRLQSKIENETIERSQDAFSYYKHNKETCKKH
jgi:hypothetical protein